MYELSNEKISRNTFIYELFVLDMDTGLKHSAIVQPAKTLRLAFNPLVWRVIARSLARKSGG